MSRVKRTLIFVHRWLGVPLSLFFAVWFPSAIGMMYWDFPSVTPADRLVRAMPLESGSIAIPPEIALARSGLRGQPSEVRLDTFDGRPVYRIRAGRDERVVFADTGELRGTASSVTLRRVAARWAGRDEDEARADAVTTVDQWTVQGPLSTMRPLWKFSFADGQQVYISQATGEVVQFTTTASRIGAYLGPIPHWLYFTPLRQRQQLWSAVVIWSSGIATVSVALGLVIGTWMSAPKARIPYRGQKRWHTTFGLVFGAGAMTWAFSGMLSMDPFPATPSPAPVGVRDPLSMDAFATRGPREALVALAPLRVKELEWVSVAGDPAYLATLDDGTTRVVPVAGSPARTFDAARIATTLTSSGAKVSVQDRYDAYYLDRRHLKPLPVLKIFHQSTSVSDTASTVSDTGPKSVTYVDPATARVVGSYSSNDWTRRWLYHGLHSLDLPWLYDHRPLWDILVIALMLGGTALSVTSILLAYRVVR
jgi:hypothetical protein